MTWGRGRNTAHAAAVAELREREDRAPRLRDQVPQLTALRLHLADDPASGRDDLRGYTKPVHVATAPAHFELHCLESRCDGYHDLTSNIMDELQAGHREFSGDSYCHGLVGDNACGRVLVFRAEASFKAGAAQ